VVEWVQTVFRGYWVLKRVIGFLLVCLVLSGCGVSTVAPEVAVEVTVVPETEETDWPLTVYTTAEEAYCAVLQGEFSGIWEEEYRRLASSYMLVVDSPYLINGWEYTLVDMDDDKIPELFIRMKESHPNSAIFHWADGRLDCWAWDDAEMTSSYTPLRDGTVWAHYKSSNSLLRFQGIYDTALIEHGSSWAFGEPYPPDIEEKYVRQLIDEEDWYLATDLSPLLPRDKLYAYGELRVGGFRGFQFGL